MRNLTVTLVVAIALMGGFYAGFRYEKANPPATAVVAAASPPVAGAPAGRPAVSPGTGTGTGQGAGAAGGFGGRGTAGQVVSLSGGSLTLKDLQGNEVKVTLQGSTTIVKTVAASAGDLVAGANVTVAGQRGADGSVTAATVTILPAGAALRPGG